MTDTRIERSAGSTLDTPVWVVVPAAGSGQRLGGELAKQYQMLDGVSMLERTLQGMLNVPGVCGLVVALSAEDNHWGSVSIDDNRLHTTIGGNTRAESVCAGLHYVLQNTTAETWVMVHDAARPLVAGSDIQRLVNAVYNTGAIGGLLASPVHDTLKKADEYAGVSTTVDRRRLWQAQTPQLFRAGELHNALSDALADPDVTVTDEASAMEIQGHQPLLVEALQPNFKITRPVDLQLAVALLQSARMTMEPNIV